MKNQKYEKIAVDLGIVILMEKFFYQKGREHLPEIKPWWAIDGKPKIKGFLKTLLPKRNSRSICFRIPIGTQRRTQTEKEIHE